MGIVQDFVDGISTFVRELNPFSSPTEKMDQDGGVTVNGVELPRDLVLQLQQLGVPLTSYTKGQLEEALQAYAMDGRLVEDHGATNFQDSLHLSSEEAAQGRGQGGANTAWQDRVRSNRQSRGTVDMHGGHVAQIEEERLQSALLANEQKV